MLGHMRDPFNDNDTSHIADTKSAGRFDPLAVLGCNDVKHHASGGPAEATAEEIN